VHAAGAVLDENFDDVISLGNISNSGTPNVCINSGCTAISAGLPAGTTGNRNTGPAPVGANTAPDNSNVRRGDNTINTSTGVNGFSSFFSTSTGNGFLVLGDDTNTIADGSPNSGVSFTRLPFAIGAGVSAATIRFDWAFNGQDGNPSADDVFTVRIVDSTGNPLFTLLSRSSSTGYGHGTAMATWGPGSSFGAGNYQLEFMLDEVSDQTGQYSTQSAVGIDNVVVTAVPEPQPYAFLLAGFGIVGLLAARRGASVQTAGRRTVAGIRPAGCTPG
jgi:hypothetical protein